jgi:hypothetical protein
MTFGGLWDWFGVVRKSSRSKGLVRKATDVCRDLMSHDYRVLGGWILAPSRHCGFGSSDQFSPILEALDITPGSFTQLNRKA